MLNTLGVVQVPPASTLPGLKANRGFQGKTLLEWVVRRVTDCQGLAGVIVVAPAEDDAANLADLVPPDVPLFPSLRRDALGQIADALTTYHARGVVRVGIEQPFVDPELIDRLVTRAASAPRLRLHRLLLAQRQAGDSVVAGHVWRVLSDQGIARRRPRGHLAGRSQSCHAVLIFSAR